MSKRQAKRRRRPTKAKKIRLWWQSPGNWVLLALSGTAVFFLATTFVRQIPPTADIDQAVIASVQLNDPRMARIEDRFRCPCGNCGHLELRDCICDVPGGALEMKTAIARLLAAGASEEQVVETVARRFGGLTSRPPSAIASHDSPSSSQGVTK